MFDLLLANNVEVHPGVLAAVVTALLTGIPAGLKLVWSYWTRREQDKTARYKEVLDRKDETVKAKDDRITELQKELSKKSDQHAKKVEELMLLAITKVEEWGERFMTQQDKLNETARAFDAAVRSLKVEPDGD